MPESLELEIPAAFEDLLLQKRYKVYYGGRGGAKSRSFGIVLLAMGMTRKIGVLCARELQVSIKDSVHSLLRLIIEESDVFSQWYNVTQQEILGKNGTRFSFKGLKHNVSEIKSYEGVDYCWVEEAQAVSDASWEVLIPTIRKEASEIWVSFNPKNPTDPTYQRFVMDADDDMFVKMVSYKDNPYFPQVLEQERLKLQAKDPEAYKHVWEGEFDTRYTGSVYAKYVKQDQILEYDYDKTVPIQTAWDLGYDDATAIIWFQVVRGEIHILDYYEANFEDPIHYCEQLHGKRLIINAREERSGKITSWKFGEVINERRASYNYVGSRHWVPHDAQAKLLAAGGRSFTQQCAELGVKMYSLAACSQQDGEAALRGALGKAWFMRDTTKDLVQALMNYHYEYDDDKKVYSRLPTHDWSSHGCDAAEIMARAWKGNVLTTMDITRKMQDAEFFAKRRKHKLTYSDPYRIKPMGKHGHY